MRTYTTHNGNGAPVADLGSSQIWDSAVGQDITAPGYIVIPVCSWNELYGNWYSASFDGNFNANYSTYPCNKV